MITLQYDNIVMLSYFISPSYHIIFLDLENIYFLCFSRHYNIIPRKITIVFSSFLSHFKNINTIKIFIFFIFSISQNKYAILLLN